MAGVSADVMGSTNEKLTDFVFASDLLKKLKAHEMAKLRGKS